MTPSLFTYTWLLPFGVLVSLSTGELEFYQDTVLDTSDDIGLKQLATYIAKQNRQQQQSRLHRSYVYPLLTPQIHKKHYVSHDHQKERDILEALKEKLIDNALREENLMALNYRHQTKYDDSVKDALPENKYEYYDSNPMSKNFDEYPDLKIPYQDKFNRENSNNDDNGNGYLRDVAFLKQSQYDGINMEGGTERGTMSKFRGNHYVFSDEGAQINGKLIQSHASIPEFTFKFDDTNIAEKNPFAVKPNDPRYYLDEPFSAGMDLEYHEVLEDNEKLEREKVNKHTEAKQTTTTEYDRIKNVTMDALAEAERRAGYHPLIVPVSHDLNNDIYFIAIVAGCSAAAMFALVLISLTWCRLQRGVKAAADIEYPAYGVTGPNKDVSPSGDQRLAQSAQMYHFQHQKQQIIAMENRTSATRDPGSVSEAESDEENEEGDYTVYECPGLAPTGEMEVKNPLFHDDPTPATSTHTNKEEDHM